MRSSRCPQRYLYATNPAYRDRSGTAVTQGPAAGTRREHTPRLDHPHHRRDRLRLLDSHDLAVRITLDGVNCDLDNGSGSIMVGLCSCALGAV